MNPMFRFLFFVTALNIVGIQIASEKAHFPKGYSPLLKMPSVMPAQELSTPVSSPAMPASQASVVSPIQKIGTIGLNFLKGISSFAVGSAQIALDTALAISKAGELAWTYPKTATIAAALTAYGAKKAADAWYAPYNKEGKNLKDKNRDYLSLNTQHDTKLSTTIWSWRDNPNGVEVTFATNFWESPKEIFDNKQDVAECLKNDVSFLLHERGLTDQQQKARLFAKIIDERTKIGLKRKEIEDYLKESQLLAFAKAKRDQFSVDNKISKKDIQHVADAIKAQVRSYNPLKIIKSSIFTHELELVLQYWHYTVILARLIELEAIVNSKEFLS